MATTLVDPCEGRAADEEYASTLANRPPSTCIAPLTDSLEDNIRSGILRLLDLIGDPAAQERYERDVPMANVPAELVSMWFDDQCPSASSSFRAAFTAAELQLLAEFHQFYDSRTRSLPSSRRVRDLHRCRAWTEIMAMAASVRSRIR